MLHLLLHCGRHLRKHRLSYLLPLLLLRLWQLRLTQLWCACACCTAACGLPPGCHFVGGARCAPTCTVCVAASSGGQQLQVGSGWWGEMLRLLLSAVRAPGPPASCGLRWHRQVPVCWTGVIGNPQGAHL